MEERGRKIEKEVMRETKEKEERERVSARGRNEGEGD